MTTTEYDAAPWRRSRFATTRGTKTVSGFGVSVGHRTGHVCHPFAADRRERGWTLTHTPSGYSLAGQVPTLREAKALARSLVRHTGGTEPWEWGEAGKKAPKKLPPECAEALHVRHVVV